MTNQVVPLYYDRDASGLPRGWITRQKNALRSLAWRFSYQEQFGVYNYLLSLIHVAPVRWLSDRGKTEMDALREVEGER